LRVKKGGRGESKKERGCAEKAGRKGKGGNSGGKKLFGVQEWEGRLVTRRAL